MSDQSHIEPSAALPTCSACPNFVFITNPKCKYHCQWGGKESNCLECIIMGAWVLCPHFLVLRGRTGMYGEAYHIHQRHLLQWQKRTWLITRA